MRPNDTYRPDLDGLRAIAVLSVVVFHFWDGILLGGFIGVDVFFVISGFLITSHILRDMNEKRFSLAVFYARRVKRIAPAMLVVVGVTLTAATLVMLPEDSIETAKSAVFSVSSLANVFFWRYEDLGYFGVQGRNLPLLHLWSLGVEEQFYIVWPLVLMFCYRVNRARGFVVAMAIAAAISFVLGDLLFPLSSSFTFYMLPTRAGELLVGAIASRLIVSRTWAGLPRRWLTPIALVGFLLLAGSIAFVTNGMVFPGLLAVPPTIGTALLILTRRDGTEPVARLLAFRPLAWTGLISYSVYLWHWPLLAFYRYGFGDPGWRAGLSLFAITLVLAWLSYRFVEQPARHTRAGLQQIFIRQYILPATAIGAVGLVVVYADRVWPSRLTTPYRQQVAAFGRQVRPVDDYPYVCQRAKLSLADLENPKCVIGVESTKEPSVLLWGDSNAGHYVGVLGAFARHSGFRFRNLEVNACPPLLSDPTPFIDARRKEDCVASRLVVERAMSQASVLIVGGSWTAYQWGSPRFISAFYATVKELTRQGKDVILLGKIPVLPGVDRQCREKALHFPLMRCMAVRAPLSGDVAAINADLKRFAENNPHVRYYDVNSFLCPNGVCSANDRNDQLLYYNTSHLSIAGSWSIGERIIERDGVPSLFAALSRDALDTAPASR